MGMRVRFRIAVLTCADCPMLINKLTRQLPLRDIRYLDPFTVRVSCPNDQLQKLHIIAENNGAEVRMLTPDHAMNALCQILLRPILLLSIVLLCMATAYIPTRVLFIQVEGNHSVPTKQIIEAAENCGIRFGTLRSSVRSEQLKNRLLELIPELQWVGVNTSGCTAQIVICERNTSDAETNEEKMVSSIVAVKDGIVLQCDVTQGTSLCRPGQAVSEGQVLISGYTDNGLTISASRANGEVQALTNRSLEVISPITAAIRSDVCTIKHYYSIRFGKKLINLQKDSGISTISCAKIYSEEYANLPGGFRLPISVIRTTEIQYETQQVSQFTSIDTNWISSSAQDYLRTQMIGGEILSAVDSVDQLSDCVILQGSYTCREMIGRIKYEESMYQHGENN